MSNLGSSLSQIKEVWTLPEVNDHMETDAHLCSMRLINIEAFLTRESLIEEGKPVDCCTKVLNFWDDEKTDYAILSHRWMKEEVEVDYREMIKLAKMTVEERNEIRQRDGYRKIHQSCEQARANGYEWLWVDTCCIDKRSSAELSEAINSMYRWYQNAKVCYAYLHDVPGPSFPTASDEEKYPKFNGWPEWFSRGWTLQELIAPSNVQFFNKDWQSIGDKRAHAPTLRNITGIPEHILIHGLFGNRPCVAQIMSWAARRTTTRVEDRAYSLMGLLNVNMPMLYGEGKKAFHRLQLEIIRASNDQSIFAWDVSRIEYLQSGGTRECSILADDPSNFRACGEMELMGHDEFIEFLQGDISQEELDSIDEDQLGSFPTTNRGIQIWLLLCPFSSSYPCSRAWLPCRRGPRASSVTMAFTQLESNFYRQLSMFGVEGPMVEGPPRWCQVYLRYQDPPHRSTTFEINDSVLTKNGFTCCDSDPERDIPTITIAITIDSDSPTNHRSAVGSIAQSFGKDSDPEKVSGNTFTLTNGRLCAKLYSDSLTNHHFVVGFASFRKGWIHVSDQSNIIPRLAWRGDAMDESLDMLREAQANARAMNKAHFGVARYGRICIMQTRLNHTTRILQISSVMWMSSRRCGVKLDVFHNPGFCDALGEWTAFDVDVGSFSLVSLPIGTTNITTYSGNGRSHL